MREVLFSAVLFGFIGFCAPAGAQEHIAREYIEWSDVWLTGANQTDKPHVLLLGNSITRGYHPKVEKLLEGKAYVGRLSGSKSVGDPALLDEVAAIRFAWLRLYGGRVCGGLSGVCGVDQEVRA